VPIERDDTATYSPTAAPLGDYYFSDYDPGSFDSLDSQGSPPEEPEEPIERTYSLVQYIPVVSFKMAFSGLKLNDLNSIPNAGFSFCQYFRELLSTLAIHDVTNILVDEKSIQIKTISNSGGSLEVFTRVQYDAVEVIKYDDEPGVTFPAAADLEDPQFQAIWASMKTLENKLGTSLNLVSQGLWPISQLTPGSLQANTIRIPEAGYAAVPRNRGWWTPEQLLPVWSSGEAPQCEASGPEETEPPTPTPDPLFQVTEQNLDELQNKLGENIDLNALINGVGANNVEQTQAPDILRNLNLNLNLGAEAQPTPAPTIAPLLDVDLTVLDKQQEVVEEVVEVQDLTPPVCTLNKLDDKQLATVSLFMFGKSFKDTGVTCIDNGKVTLDASHITTTLYFSDYDGEWKIGTEVEVTLGVEVNYRVVYRATDDAGNDSAEIERLVEVVDPCKSRGDGTEICVPETKAALAKGEQFVCSVPGLETKVCDRSLLIDSEEEDVVEEDVVEDTEPPVITLKLGTGQEQETNSGVKVIVHQYEVTRGRNAWINPGYTVKDNFDPVSLITVTTNGLGAVTTAYPTESPYIIKYSATDSKGNESPEYLRLVEVVCPAGEYICPIKDGTTHAECSVSIDGGTSQCGEGADALADLQTTSESTLLGGGEEEAAVLEDPVTTLNCGAESVQISVGTAYTKCSAKNIAAGITTGCDPGCTAKDEPNGDGVITHLVEACPNPNGANAAKRYFKDQGLKFCGFDLNSVGKYTIMFCVESSRGASSRICKTREIVVNPNCEEPEFVCTLELQCSVDRLCPSDLELNTEITTSGQEVASNKDILEPPVVTLLGDSFVNLKRGTVYRKCDWNNPDDQPTADDPCDLGVNVTDHNELYEVVDMSDKAAVCPPETCVTDGDSTCMGFEFFGTAKGKPGEKLQCARIDEMAAVGTTLELRYVARDLTHSGEVGHVVVIRTITITEPCPDGNAFGSYFCEDDRQCSAVPCEQRGVVLPTEDKDTTPVVRLLGATLIRMAYGDPLTQPLGFCSSIYDTEADCGALAVMTVGKEAVIPSDLSLVAPGCLPSDAMAGVCLPGYYAFKYQAFDNEGKGSNEVTRVLIVEQRAEIEVVIKLPIDALDAVAAQAVAEQYRNDPTIIQPYLTAWIALNGASNPEINADTVYIDQVSVIEEGGAFSIGLHLKLQVSSTAVETGSFSGNADATATPTPTPTGRRMLLSSPELWTGRHLLQESSLEDKLDGTLASLTSDGVAFANAVAAAAQEAGQQVITPVIDTTPSTSTTTPTVDVLGGLISTLAASLSSYEERRLSLAFRLSTLLAEVSRVGGDGATAADLAVESAVKKDYQAMLQLFEDIIADQAGSMSAILSMFDKALAQQFALNAALSSTMEDIQEGLANQAAFLKEIATTQVFIESVIGPGWDGTGTPTPCPQAKAYGNMEFEFLVSFQNFTEQLEANATEAAGTRRRLLAAGGGKGGETFEKTEQLYIENEEEYYGYRIVAGNEYTSQLMELGSTGGLITRNRYLGGPDRNRVLGGLLIHQEREGINTSYCDLSSKGAMWGRLPGAKFTKLSSDCLQREFLRGIDDNGTWEDIWETQMSDPLHPFGSDPIWVRSSDLFNEEMGGAESDFYNMTEGSLEVNQFSKSMFAHFLREMPGKKTGFPVYIDCALDEVRLAQLLVYIEDSNYIDRRSSKITIQMAVYNPEARVFGYGKALIHRDMNGVFHQTFQFNALPAMDYELSTLSGKLDMLQENTAVICLALYLLWYLYTVFSHPHFQVQAKRATQYAVDLAIILAMLGAMILYYTIVLSTLEFEASSAYEVYDAQTFGPARLLMPKKANISKLEDSVAREEILSRLTAEGKPTGWGKDPGTPGRWELPDDNTGIEEYGEMMYHLDSLSDKVAFYGALQGIIILVMILRMLHLWNFQDQVGTVTRTLFRVMPDLGEFSFVLIILMSLYASYGIIVAGSHIEHYTTFADAFYSLFVIIVAGDGGEIHIFAHGSGAEHLTVELINIDFWYFSVWIFFFFVLTSYLLGYIGFTLAYEKQISDSGNSPIDEIKPMLLQHWQRVRWRAPYNERIFRQLEKLCDNIDNEIDLSEVLRKQLRLDVDDVVMSLVCMEESEKTLDRHDLQEALTTAHNRAIMEKAAAGQSKPAPKNPGKPENDIMQAVESIISSYGQSFTVDPESVEELISNTQFEMYEAVLECIRPSFDAAAELFEQQAKATQELAVISKDLYFTAQALGDTSIPAFSPHMPSVELPCSLSSFHKSVMPNYRSDTGSDNPSSRFSHPNAVPSNKLKVERHSFSSSDNSLRDLKNHKAAASTSGRELPVDVSWEAQEAPGGGFVSRVSRAIGQIFWGLTGGSPRRQVGTIDEHQGLLVTLETVERIHSHGSPMSDRSVSTPDSQV